MSKQTEALKLAQDWYDSGHEDPDEFTEMIKQVIALAEQPAQQQERKTSYEELERIADDLQELCDKQAIRLGKLEAQQQEPVAWGVDWGKAGDQSCVSIIKRLPDGSIEVLATEYGPPASKPWVGLTDEEMREVYKRTDWDMAGGWEYERAIEAKLREKNA